MKNKSKNKLKIKIFGIIVLFLILFFVLIILCINIILTGIIEKKEIYANVIVGEKYGFDLNGTALTFGMITPGASSSSREIILTNNYKRDVLVEISSQGVIKDFLKISKNNFILKTNETDKIGFIVSVPLDCKFGSYDGEVTILIKKSRS